MRLQLGVEVQEQAVSVAGGPGSAAAALGGTVRSSAHSCEALRARGPGFVYEAYCVRSLPGWHRRSPTQALTVLSRDSGHGTKGGT